MKQRVKPLLINQPLGKPNMVLTKIMDIFSLVFSINMSYQIVEKLYLDKTTVVVIHNLNFLKLKKRDVFGLDSPGNGAVYSLTLRTNY